jgi:hypothetical protein
MELLGAVLNNDGSVVLGNNERIVIADTIRFLWEVSFTSTLTSLLFYCLNKIRIDDTEL